MGDLQPFTRLSDLLFKFSPLRYSQKGRMFRFHFLNTAAYNLLYYSLPIKLLHIGNHFGAFY